LKQRRERETTQEFKQLYAKRAGIEGTISQGVRTMGLRRSRYIGQEKTHLQHVATAAALNLVRSLAWESGVPRAQTRRSAFARLYEAV
jgi:transposase